VIDERAGERGIGQRWGVMLFVLDISKIGGHGSNFDTYK